MTRPRVYIAPEPPPRLTLAADYIETLPVPNWPAYQVDNRGVVYGHRGRLKARPNQRGYLCVTLQEKGRPKWHVKVGRLVCEAFLGPANGRMVRHLNDDKTDNRLVNLAYGNGSDNAEDARRNGRLCEGERHGRAVYTADQIRAVRRLKSEGRTYPEIERATGVRKASASHIVTGRQWGCVS